MKQNRLNFALVSIGFTHKWFYRLMTVILSAGHCVEPPVFKITSLRLFLSFQEVVTGILPISYEDEIVQKRTQILRDPLQALLVFPEDDVKVSKSFIICVFFSSTVRLNVLNSCAARVTRTMFDLFHNAETN